MEKRNYERFVGRTARSKRVAAATLAVLVAGIFAGTAQAESDTGELVQKQPVILETSGIEQVSLDSQSLDAIPVRVSVDGVIVRESGEALPAEAPETSLAMVELGSTGNSASTLGTKRPRVIDRGGEGGGANGDGATFPYALMLTLLALISLVPVSRRH